MSFARNDASGVLISVKAVPGARQEQVVGRLGDRLKVRVSQPPEGGKANKALCALLARELGVADAAVSVVRGQSSPEKVVHVRGITAEQALSRWPA